MKRILSVIAIIAIAVITSAARQPARGYRGFADVAWSSFHIDDDIWTRNENHWAFSTVHGYQFSPMIFAGVGIELAHNAWANTWYVPVFADVRGDFRLGRFTPYADIRIGWTPTSDGGFRFNPSVGYRFNWGRKAGINIGVGLTLQCCKYTTGDFWYNHENGEYGINNARTVHTARVAPVIRLGLDF